MSNSGSLSINTSSFLQNISKSSIDFIKNDDKSSEDDNFDNSILDNYSLTLDGNSKNIIAGTRIPQAITTQPTELERKKTDQGLLKKFRARVREKIVSLEKALDTYGVIDEIIYSGQERIISARIYDIYDHGFIDEIKFNSNEFSKSDREKIIENAIFYWFVGVEINLLGNEHRVSEFRLRRVFTEK